MIAVGNGYRAYSRSPKTALILGLMQAGISVIDIGPALSPWPRSATLQRLDRGEAGL